jgi:hypothetical protein
MIMSVCRLGHNMTVCGANSQEDDRRKDWRSVRNRALLRLFLARCARDPAPPAMLPRWGFGGDGAMTVATKKGSRYVPQHDSQTAQAYRRQERRHRVEGEASRSRPEPRRMAIRQFAEGGLHGAVGRH